MEINYEIDEDTELTEEQKKMLMKLEEREIIFDEDSPELTKEDLAMFRRISEKKREERKKQTITLRLSPEAFKAAKELGKGYTSILSRILEEALKNSEVIKKNL